jgi:hypothetical protein
MLALITDIPSMWTIGSILSVFGILYLVVCIGIIWKGGGIGGGFTLLSFALLGALAVGLAGPGQHPDYLPTGDEGLSIHVICEGGEYPGNGTYFWGSLVNYVRAEETWRFNHSYNTFDRSLPYSEVDPDPKVYAMCVPDHPSYIHPRIFHPAAFFWSPFLMCVIGIIGGLFVRPRYYNAGYQC